MLQLPQKMAYVVFCELPVKNTVAFALNTHMPQLPQKMDYVVFCELPVKTYFCNCTQYSICTPMPQLPQKMDYVVFCELSPAQLAAYKWGALLLLPCAPALVLLAWCCCLGAAVLLPLPCCRCPATIGCSTVRARGLSCPAQICIGLLLLKSRNRR